MPDRPPSDPRPLVLYTDPEGVDLQRPTRLLERAGLRVVVEEMRDADTLTRRSAELRPVALLVTYLPVNDAVLVAADSIGLVSFCSVGFDSIDLAAATRRGVWVSNVPDAACEEVACHALAMALGLVRHLTFLDRDVRAGGWSYEATGTPRRLSELTLGVVGLGRIGSRLAEIASPLFSRVVGHDPLLPQAAFPPGVTPLGLEDCLAAADVLSLHLPLTAATHNLIDRAALARMPAGAYLVNVSRGALVDPAALVAALDDGRLAGAALDVTDPEPPAADDHVRTHPRIQVTPHAAFHSAQALEAYLLSQAKNVIAWARSGVPLTPVNQPHDPMRRLPPKVATNPEAVDADLR